MAVDDTDQSVDTDVLPDYRRARLFYSKYEPKEVLGRGVSSTVRRCVHKESGGEFAVKIIDISGAEHGASLRESTYREVDVLKLVQQHRYVIQLQDVFESSTHLFLVFELLREGELFDYLTTVVALSEKRTRLMMRQLLEALRFLHDQRVVHRDVKPENILLDEDCTTIKLTDFGFACSLDSLPVPTTGSSTCGAGSSSLHHAVTGGDVRQELPPDERLFEVLGTPGYMAPEILRAGLYRDAVGYGRPVDVWAAGVVMYTLLVGCPPFWHRKQMVMLRNIMDGRYTFGSPEWDDITEPPKDLIRSMLCVDPQRRITAAQALRHEFFSLSASTATAAARRVDGCADEATDELTESAVASVRVPFSARARFRLGILFVRAAVRIQRLKFTPEALSVHTAAVAPYQLRAIRRVVDAAAFRVYGHWVAKAQGQNRAMLFENTYRADAIRRIRRTAAVAVG